MREESITVVSGLSPEDLWDYLADYDKVVRLGWDEAGAVRLTDSISCAARYKAHTTWEGIRNTYTVCIEAAKRPTTLTWSTKNAGSRSWLRFDISPLEPARTEVTMTLTLKHGPAMRMLEPFAWGLLMPAFRKTASQLAGLSEVAPTGDTG